MHRKPHLFLLLMLLASLPLQAQTGWWGILSGAIKAGQALAITDEELARVVREEVELMDKHNQVCSPNSSYGKRLVRLTRNMKDAEGIKLNFQVYKTTDYNAFACPDGSVRVFSALMDCLSDDELLGIIGHEIGHVALRHSRKAWQDAMLRSATSDAIGAVSETWADLSDSTLGDICSAALSAKHSREHETQADDYGYEFLKKSGKNPYAMCKALQRLKELSEDDRVNKKLRKWLQVFSSHPDLDSRIQRQKDKAEAEGYKLPN